jgi:hypothetical protein
MRPGAVDEWPDTEIVFDGGGEPGDFSAFQIGW